MLCLSVRIWGDVYPYSSYHVGAMCQKVAATEVRMTSCAVGTTGIGKSSVNTQAFRLLRVALLEVNFGYFLVDESARNGTE